MNTLALMGWTEWLLLILVLLLFFGATKLPQLARSLGSSVNEFKKGLKEDGTSTSTTPPPPGDTQKKNGTVH
ncbi:MAG: twin-arginine translocase TatA/TatE family subunit [Planctomycetes bacterium]|nr:twin-arginine translocase TatA/TatE family subunit [Planctomycetota bacterium]